jgi:hypothetical protein
MFLFIASTASVRLLKITSKLDMNVIFLTNKKQNKNYPTGDELRIYEYMYTKKDTRPFRAATGLMGFNSGHPMWEKKDNTFKFFQLQNKESHRQEPFPAV